MPGQRTLGSTTERAHNRPVSTIASQDVLLPGLSSHDAECTLRRDGPNKRRRHRRAMSFGTFASGPEHRREVR